MISVLEFAGLSLVLPKVRATISNPDSCMQVVELATIELEKANQMVPSVTVIVILVSIHLLATQAHCYSKLIVK